MVKYGLIALAFFYAGNGVLIEAQTTGATLPPDSDNDRPHLRHQDQPMAHYGVPDHAEPLTVDAIKGDPAEPLVAPDLHLPATGKIWVVDAFQGVPRPVHITYSQVNLDNHTGANLAKGLTMPFVYKQKKTVELRGASAAIRLHTGQPEIYIRDLIATDDEATPGTKDNQTALELVLIRLDVQQGKRIVNTVAFSRVLLKAARSEGRIEVKIVPVPGSRWFRMIPVETLAAGEYGLVPLPKGQNLFSPIVYDFAVDPSSPVNKEEIVQSHEQSDQQSGDSQNRSLPSVP